MTTYALVGLLACTSFSAGCEVTSLFGTNMTVDLIVPLGLGGTPGLFNPFGLVQAWVNSLFGARAPAVTGGEGDEATPDGSSPPIVVDPAISVIVG